ncbi:MAG: RecX family transcriptional regulator [Candidatus Cloacimonetes bacterium]|nr:RecX family transcriptional regulator [Candidatus Cloacimonadota bacterium]
MIRLQPRNKTQLFVEADDHIIGVVSRSSVKPYISGEGEQVLNNRLLPELKQMIESFTWDRLLNYLARREHTEAECRQYLTRYRTSGEIAEKLLQKALKMRYVSDERAAEMFISAMVRQAKPEVVIRGKLHEKGISEPIIESAIARFLTRETVNELCLNAVRKAVRRFRQLPESEKFDKIMTALYRQGFDYYDVKDLVLEKLKEVNEEV